MRYAVPVEYFLLLLRPDAIVFVQEIKECALRLFERGIGAGFEIAKIGKDAFFELFGILDRSAKGLEAKCQAADNVCACDVE